MIAVSLLLCVIFWMAWSWSRDWLEARHEQKRRELKIQMRQQILAASPNSPGSYEALGDAMRDANFYADAAACYEEAIDMASKQGGPGGAGWIAGAGLETKLKLARLERAEQAAPSYGHTMKTRQQLCRQCGYLNLPQAVSCSTCSAPLPVDSMFDTLRNDDMRGAIVRETTQMVAMLSIVLVAVWIVSSMPLLLRLTITISAVIVIPIRLLKLII